MRTLQQLIDESFVEKVHTTYYPISGIVIRTEDGRLVDRIVTHMVNCIYVYYRSIRHPSGRIDNISDEAFKVFKIEEREI